MISIEGKNQMLMDNEWTTKRLVVEDFSRGQITRFSSKTVYRSWRRNHSYTHALESKTQREFGAQSGQLIQEWLLGSNRSIRDERPTWKPRVAELPDYCPRWLTLLSIFPTVATYMANSSCPSTVRTESIFSWSYAPMAQVPQPMASHAR
jgi:hypothetical protein